MLSSLCPRVLLPLSLPGKEFEEKCLGVKIRPCAENSLPFFKLNFSFNWYLKNGYVNGILCGALTSVYMHDQVCVHVYTHVIRLNVSPQTFITCLW
jgi:hypothetical protein